MGHDPCDPAATRWARLRPYVVPCVLLVCVAAPFLHRGDWARADSGLYAAVGLQAWRTGDLWTLYAAPGDPYFNKPPLAIWVHGLALHLIGANAWAARLPSLLAAAGCLLATIGLMRRLAGPGAALWTGVVLALTYDFARRSASISLDLWQLMFMMLTAWAVAVGVDRAGSAEPAERRRAVAWFVAAGVPMGLALMCKPLTALFIPAVLAPWLWWIGRASLIPWLGAMLAVGAAVAAPWHVSMYALHGDAFIDQYFGVQVAGRAAGELTAAPFDAKPAWYYVREIGTTHWPWLLLVGAAVVRWWRLGRLSEAGAAERWALVWTIGWFVALTVFPDRRARYALPLMPSLAVLAGLWISGQRPARGWATRGVDVLALIAAGAAVVGLMIPARDRTPAQWGALHEWIDARAAESDGTAPELWQGALATSRGARLYLRYGRWPRATRSEAGKFLVDRVDAPPPGALLLYHRRDGLAPGPNETRVFESGDLRVMRLEAGVWTPAVIADPGEGD